jgi:predicted RNase H-like nuclease (RuvC/YqgF family)
MAKRPTIGRNPLDILVTESHLDKVVPDLVAGPPEVQASVQQEEVAGLKERLEASTAENLALREELLKLKTQVYELKKRLDQGDPLWINLKKRFSL